MANISKTLRFVVSVSALAVTLQSPAFADDNRDQAVAQASTDYIGLTSGGSLQSPDHIAGSGFEHFTPSFQLSSKDDKISADFSVDYTLASAPQSKDGRLSGNFLTFSLKGSVPLNGASADSKIDFKSFGDGGSLTLGFNYFSASVVSASVDHPVIVRSARACVAGAIAGWVDAGNQSEADAVAAKAALNRFDTAAKDDTFGVDEVVRASTTKQPAKDSVEAAIAKSCTKAGNSFLTNDTSFATLYASSALSPAEYGAWRREHRKNEGTLFFGGEVSLGYNRFSIADRTSLSVIGTSRVGFDGNLRAGLIFSGASTMVLGNLGYTRSYKAKDVVDVCGPPDLSGKTTCINGQDGLPDREETGYAGVTLRQVVVRNSKGQPMIGIRPSATYIFEDKDWQFEFPVYLQHNDKGGLDAGVRAIFNTGEKKFAFGAFVGVPF